MAESVHIHNLEKRFASPDAPGQEVHAVRNANLEVTPGELVTLLGPSGCGKTTLLRMIAGFEEPTSGDILFGERRMNDVAPNRRDAAMVFQSYAIFPHLSVYENVVFGLRLQKLSDAELKARADKVLAVSGLTSMANRSPNQLSGGQQQRVALARAIVMEPKVLLFDEPLSNLDAKLRDQMRVEIRDLQQRLGITSLYVTHDQIEAMSISDRIVVMNSGNIEQIGTPREVYARPASRFVAEFIGKANFPEAIVADAQTVDLRGVKLPVPTSGNVGDKVTLVLRPEAIALSATEGDFAATVRRAMFLGNVAEYLIEIEGLGEWLVDVPNPGEKGLLDPGQQIFASPSHSSLHALRG
ncbi:ABC transporter ATP-binding protein [Aerobium aerolatum]|uniref:Iron(III) transport system ATP-binding protein n=1 Tax=Aquamicrobium aerolatum DSM 21857 TaxID=1121003 RepID=A0A1I3M113_9HYPH|nr:ABC transporter ATP-binding protein [Aquamicrobium aerolatum]SFI90480.1 iron(III) transport system ATP-binding protein [Aquamicrobium aerolatum DSM 21857]